jgi:cytochrome c oxidase assembly protein Cox11
MLFQWYLIGISMVFQWYSRHIQPTYLGYLGVAVVVLVIGCMYIYIQLYDVICTTILYDHRYSAYANYYGYAQL